MTIILNGSTGITTPADTVTGNETVGGTLTVTGASTLTGGATIGGVAAVAVAPGAVGNVIFTTDGSTWSSTQKITQGTSVTVTTNTSVDFTSIPSWVKRISMMFYTVSINGTSRPTVRLGTSGGIVSTGYSGSQYGVAGTGGAFTNLSSGFDLIDSGSAVSGCNFCGILTIDKLGTGNDWVANWFGGLVNAPVMQSMGGAVSISGALTTVRLTTQGGTVQFTGGTVNILYE
jgi:hypothetical protein